MNAHHDKPSPDTDNIFGLVKQQIAIKNGPFEEVLFIIHGDFPASPVTFPETNSSHLKIDCWKTTFLSFWNPAYFQGRLLLVSGTGWAPASCKWSYNLYRWPYKWVIGVITLLHSLKLTARP